MYNITSIWEANPSKIFAYEEGKPFLGYHLLKNYNIAISNLRSHFPFNYVILCGNNSINWVLCYLASKHLKKAIIITPPNIISNVLRHYKLLKKQSFLILDKKINDSSLKQKSFDELFEEKTDNDGIKNNNICSLDNREILFTSGTTGIPKGVIISEEAIKYTINTLLEKFNQQKNDVELLSMPFSHSFGLVRLRCSLYINCVLYISNGLKNIPKIYKDIINLPITGLSFVPSAMEIFKKILKTDVKNISDKINYIELGSSKISIPLRKWLKDSFPNTIIFIHYGATEASRSFFLELGKNDDFNYDGFLGKISKETIFKLESTVKTSDQNLKEIHLRGKNLADGYLDSISLECLEFKNGWFNTSDIGYLKNNKLFLRGRSDNIINVGGIKISAEIMERELLLMDFIEDILIFPITDSVFGQRIVAITILNYKKITRSKIIIKFKQIFKEKTIEHHPKIIWESKTIPLSNNGKKVRDQKTLLNFTKNLKKII